MLAAGQAAPSFTLVTPAGKREPLASFWKSSRVVLAFFKSACPTCQLALPFLNRVPGGLSVVGISQDSAAVTMAFAERFRVRIPLLLDDPEEEYPASNSYGIHHVPTLFVVGADGRIEQVIEGFHKAALEGLGIVFTEADRVPVFKPG